MGGDGGVQFADLQFEALNLFSVGADGLLGGRFEGFFLVIANLFVELQLL